MIGVRPAEVMGLLTSPGHLAECHPFCESNPVDRWPGEGSHDTVVYHNGRVVHRHVTSWRDEVGFSVDVSDENGRLAAVDWEVSEAAGGSKLTIRLAPYPLSTYRPVVRSTLQQVVVRPMLRRYLRSVVRGVRWRLETGDPVQRDQFGRHAWFS